ncbi:MAG: hypothetical protein IJ999_06425 [Clostridia bacterium]|nr:hypothetical protein [Clostridia bacterium]
MLAKSKYSLLVVAIILVFSVPGVFAVWTYASGVVDPVKVEIPAQLFDWLPGMGIEGDDDQSEVNISGTNHAVIIGTLIGKEGFVYGDGGGNTNDPNSGFNGKIADRIEDDYENIANVGVITGGNYKNWFPSLDSGGAKALSFVLQFAGDDLPAGKRYVFTFKTEDANRTNSGTNGNGVRIEVYRTTLIWNENAYNKYSETYGIWEQGSSEKGHAPVCQYIYDKNKTSYIIDCHYWEKGAVPAI